jgi:hypothetical protein
MYPSTKTKFYSSILKLVIIYSHDRSSMSYLQGNYKLIYICRIASERLSEPTTTFNNFSEGMHKLVILYLSLIWPVKKKLKTDCFIDEKYVSKKNYPLELYRQHYSADIISYVIVSYVVKIFLTLWNIQTDCVCLYFHQ